MNIISAAVNAALAARDQLAGRLITIRDGDESVELRATTGESQFSHESSDALTTKLRTRDYLFAAADLILAAEVTEPAAGMEIDDTEEDGTATKWEIYAPGGSEPAWRYSDSHRTRIRVHAREITEPE